MDDRLRTAISKYNKALETLGEAKSALEHLLVDEYGLDEEYLRWDSSRTCIYSDYDETVDVKWLESILNGEDK